VRSQDQRRGEEGSLSGPDDKRVAVTAAEDEMVQESQEWAEEMAHFFDDGEDTA